MVTLQLNQALLVLQNLRHDPIRLCHQVTACNKCEMECETETIIGTNSSVVLNSQFIHRIAVKVADDYVCMSERSFLDREECILSLFANSSSCSFTVTREGMNELIPLWTMIGVYFVLAAVIYVAIHFWKSYKSSGQLSRPVEEDSDETGVTSASAETAIGERAKVSQQRIKSLDSFRGAVILLMIFVNYGGGGCAWFEHAPWYGLTIADLVFPAFILAMGFSIALSTRSRLTAKKDFVLLLCKVMRRSAKLLALGIILNTDHTDLSNLRIPGVLQRFAISYFFVAIFHVLSVFRANRFLSQPEDIARTQLLLIFAPEILAHFTVLLMYLYFTFWFDYGPECPKGYQGPGGMEHGAKFINCTGGAAGFLDRQIFGLNHLYQWPTSKQVFHHTQPHDPEGLLGCTTSILLTEFGLICGRIMIKVRSHNRRMICWFIAASCAGSLALLLTSLDVIPVIKNLWSLSFVCATGALSLSLFIVFYFLIDGTRVWTNGTPFHYAGSNAILLYVGHILLSRYFPFYFEVTPTHAHLLARVSFSCLLWLLIAVYLFSKRIFWVL